MKVFELLPRPLGSIFRKLTHFACNSPMDRGDAACGLPQVAKRTGGMAPATLGDAPGDAAGLVKVTARYLSR